MQQHLIIYKEKRKKNYGENYGGNWGENYGENWGKMVNFEECDSLKLAKFEDFKMFEKINTCSKKRKHVRKNEP